MAMNESQDLPLLANTRDFLLYHYILDLEWDFNQRCASGNIYLFLKPSYDGKSQQVFSIQEYQAKIRDVQGFSHSDQNSASTPPSCQYEKRSQENADTEAAKSATVKFQSDSEKIESDEHKTGGKINTEMRSHGESDSERMQHDSPIKLILDCCEINVHSVCEVTLSKRSEAMITEAHRKGGSLCELRDEYLTVTDSKCQTSSLCHLVEKWCIKIWKPCVTEAQYFPRIVKINYSTTPEGASLRWAEDQDDLPCTYSAAMWINNRAFFPCAEFGNLSTWQAFIQTPEGASALMSGDNNGEAKLRHNGNVAWYHECSMPMPPFTLAIAIGHWDNIVISLAENPASIQRDHKKVCSHIPPCQIVFSEHTVLPCRLFGCQSLLMHAEEVLSPYWASCSSAVQEILGPHPFPRVDFVIYPSCSQDMALANPSLIFISQSLLAKDQSMCIRISHELSHSWFGLLIGAKDWTEEWLSEGFATYMEDSIHSKALGWNEEEQRDRSDLRALIRHRTLCGEMAHTKEELQTLRPIPQHVSQDSDSSVMFVKNGLNPEKLFTQVHYLKGYFLLRHLSCHVGVARFDEVLYTYIQRFHGQLVLSKEFLQHVFAALPELHVYGLNVESVYADWLDEPGMPKVLEGFQASSENKLYMQVTTEVGRWKAVDWSNRRRGRRTKRQRTNHPGEFIQVEPDQLVLILEHLLEEPVLSPRTLALLRVTYNLHTHSPDVRHRWGELVVKHRYKPAYEDVRDFLTHHQAMGVYLYGEMVLSGCRVLGSLARECFGNVQAQMETGTRKLVHSMLYGAPP